MSENELKLVRGDPFVYTTRELFYPDRELRLVEFVPVSGDPPEKWRRFHVNIQVPIGERVDKRTGEKQVISRGGQVHLEAETLEEALEEAPEKRKAAAEQIMSQFRQEMLLAGVGPASASLLNGPPKRGG